VKIGFNVSEALLKVLRFHAIHFSDITPEDLADKLTEKLAYLVAASKREQ
jgi:hypothetical protein